MTGYEELQLELLLLTKAELEAAREKVQEMAYLKWEEAGCPEGTDSDRFWQAAEQEWIQYHYVPDR